MPADWPRRRLGEVLRLEYGKPLPEKERRPGPAAVVGSAGIVGAHSEGMLPGPGIVIGRKGSIGKVTWLSGPFFPIDTTYFVDFVDGDVDPRWAYHTLSRAELPRLNRATGVPGLNRDDVHAIVRPIPPLPEQRAIAAVLDAVDETIERTESVIAATEELRRALLHELLTRGVPGRHSEWKHVPGLGTVPACWEVAPVGQMYEVQLGKMLSAETRIGDYVRPYLTNRNVRWGSFDLTNVPSMHFSESERQRFRLTSGDLLVCEGGEVGRAAVWDGEIAECYYQKALHRLRPTSPAQVPEFMRYLLEYASHRGWFTDYTGQTSIAHLTREKLLSMRVPCPTGEEQKQMSSAVRTVEAQRDVLVFLRERTFDTKRTLAGALLTGQVRVKEALGLAQ